jgi:hypothetical protein
MRRPERIFIPPLLLLFLLAGSPAPGGSLEPFSVGEKIRYSIVVEGMKVGNQTMQVSALTEMNGRKAYLIEGHSTSSTLLGILYRLDDKWDIYVDARTLYPMKVEKDWAEGKNSGMYVYDIDQENMRVRHRDLIKGTEKEIIPKNPVFDIFSLLYFYRANAQTLENPFEFDFLETRSVKTVRFEDLGEEKLLVFAVSPRTPCRVRRLKQVGGLGIEIFVGVDELRLPLKLITPAKLSKKKTLEIEFVIDGYSPGGDRGETPPEYRRLKY